MNDRQMAEIAEWPALLVEQIEDRLDKETKISLEDALKLSFNYIFDFMELAVPGTWIITGSNTFGLRNSVYEACFFTSLAMFLHGTDKLDKKAKTLKQFVYDNSTSGYKRKYHPDCSDIAWEKKEQFEVEEQTFRRARHRFLSTRAVYKKEGNEWKAMRADEEYEWSLYYKLDIGNGSTYKKLKNLLNSIKDAIDSTEDEDYGKRLIQAYKTFSSKLEKIKYEDYIALLKEIVEHINQDKTYYGMNIYRLEKELRPYIVVAEVNDLLNCGNDAEEDKVINRILNLNDIHFPKVYKILSALDDSDFADVPFPVTRTICANYVNDFIKNVSKLCNLIYDVLIDDCYFGKEWEILFLDTVNNLTEKVFYDPETIDFSIKPNSQEKFMEILDEQANTALVLAAEVYDNFRASFYSFSEEDEEL